MIKKKTKKKKKQQQKKKKKKKKKKTFFHNILLTFSDNVAAVSGTEQSADMKSARQAALSKSKAAGTCAKVRIYLQPNRICQMLSCLLERAFHLTGSVPALWFEN